MNKSQESTLEPLFIPHLKEIDSSKVWTESNKFQEREFKVCNLPNGNFTKSKFVESIKKMTNAEVYTEPFSEIKEKKNDSLKKKKTIYNIFKRNSKIGTSFSKINQDVAKCDISVTIDCPDEQKEVSNEIENKNTEDKVKLGNVYDFKSNMVKPDENQKKINTNVVHENINDRPILPSSPIKISTIPRLAYAPNYPHYERMSDLRKILNPQVEKRDFETILRSFWDSILDCHCFECTFNNAAKIVTFLVLLITFILVIKAVVSIAHYV